MKKHLLWHMNHVKYTVVSGRKVLEVKNLSNTIRMKLKVYEKTAKI